MLIKMHSAFCLVLISLATSSFFGAAAAREPYASLEAVTSVAEAQEFLDDHPDRQHQLRRIVDLVKVTSAAAQALPEFQRRQQRHLQNSDALTGLLTTLLPYILQLIDILNNGCDLVNAQFPEGEVICQCTGSLLSSLRFTCSFLEICVDGKDGNFCLTPSYKGSLSLLAVTSINEVCASNVTLFQTLPLGDLCITLAFDPVTQNLIDCEVSFLDLVCLTCTPCPSGGIALQCGLDPGEVPTNPANCLNFGGLITTATDEQNLITEPFAPFTFVADVLEGNVETP